MSADALLSRVNGVRQTGAGRWLGRCPAHDDRSPSLSVRELEDGRVLVHCFAGCSVEEILSATSLDLQSLFPERVIEGGKPVRRPFSALEALRCVRFEATLAAVAASNLAQGVPMSREDRLRLHAAAKRIDHALEVALGW